MAETKFEVVYEGPALANGRMEIRDLAPGLLALGDLFASAQAVIDPDEPRVSLSIQATTPGSFDLLLVLATVQEFGSRTVGLFASDPVSALANLKELVTGEGGVLWFIKRLAGREVSRAEGVEPGRMRLTTADGDSLDIQTPTWDAYNRVTVRKAARTFVNPLERPGVERLEIREESETTFTLSRDDVPAFEMSSSEPDEVAEQRIEMTLDVVQPALAGDYMWRVSDGTSNFRVAITDEDFLLRVRAGEAFRAGDRLRCTVEFRQTLDGDGKLSTHRTVVAVHEHLPRPDPPPALLLRTD